MIVATVDLTRIVVPAHDIPDGRDVTITQRLTRRIDPTQWIAEAGEALLAARGRRDVDAVADAKHDLQDAVDAGRDAGMTWGCIGDVLGIRRGSAYQRYRRSHAPSPSANRPPA